ncbi:MAG: DUF92 domain-containing protein [Nitrospirae bacterium]|nr:DUF92 domain-containing protein [Nitrospirota bacterium]
MPPLWLALAVNACLALAAWRWRLLTASGALAAGAVGVGVTAVWGWGGFLPLLVFFLLGTGSSFLERSAKARLGTVQSLRNWRNVLANGGVALGCAIAAGVWPQASSLWLFGTLGSLTAAAADTVSGELGMLWGRKTVWITTFQPAPRGANGAISLEGTVLGGLAGFLVALTAWGTGLVRTPEEVILLTGAGFAGMTVDSYLGALLENRGWIGNEGVNIGCTLTGAATAIWLR